MDGKQFKNKIIFKKFPEEHYYIVFNQSNGYFIRKEEEGFRDPFYSLHGPELLDISITNYCTKKCKICYRDSNPEGIHIKKKDLEIILKQAKDMNVLQIALGGGNPNQHPDFIEILRIIRKDYDIIPTYTTNGNHLTLDILKATSDYCGAMALSTTSFSSDVREKLNTIINHKIKINIHFVLSAESIENAIALLEGKIKISKKINAIIFLNYKPVGKNKNINLLLKKSPKFEHFFKLVSKNAYSFKIGFDSCSVSGLAKYCTIENNYYDFCDAARFSAFIDEKLNMYPCSFMVEKLNAGYSLYDYKMIDVWNKAKTFINIRTQLLKENNKCDFFKLCHGGCPLFDINLC